MPGKEIIKAKKIKVSRSAPKSEGAEKTLNDEIELEDTVTEDEITDIAMSISEELAEFLKKQEIERAKEREAIKAREKVLQEQEKRIKDELEKIKESTEEELKKIREERRQLEAQRRALEEEQKLLIEDKKLIETQQDIIEEERRKIEEQQDKIEEERKRLEEELKRLEAKREAELKRDLKRLDDVYKVDEDRPADLVLSVSKEIVNYLQRPGGHSILIKGRVGSGKTTFVLQTLEELLDRQEIIYFSTSGEDESLYYQFPWLEEKEKRQQMIERSVSFLEKIQPRRYSFFYEKKGDEKDEKIASAREFLSIKYDGKSPRMVSREKLDKLFKEIKMEIPELTRIYKRVERFLSKKVTVVVDSLDILTRNYDVNPTHIVFTLIHDLVEKSGTNLILITESYEESEIDYLVDGVIVLNVFDVEDRTFRDIHVLKLKGAQAGLFKSQIHVYI